MRAGVNIYDLSFRLLPECFTRERLRDMERRLAQSLPRAELILTGSEYSRGEIIRVLGVEPSRVVAIPYGVERRFSPLEGKELARVRKKYSLPESFLLYVGTIEPRKNLVTLLRAWAKICQAHPEKQLVIAGKRGWLWEKTFAELESLGLRERVFLPGYVAEDDLPSLYNLAQVFVYPSLYEGFGLPPLEAMACGLPVITSDTSSLPEVIGEGGILLPPEEVDAWAEEIEKLFRDEGRRKELGKKGRARAGKYNWEECARRTLSLYERVVNAAL